MLKSFKKTDYIIAFVVLCVFIGWAAVVASEQPFDAAEYQNRLNTTAANVLAASHDPDESLKVYAVNVVHSRPFRKPSIGYGIYLGEGTIITAAHVVGRWPYFISHPRVFIAGQDLPAKVTKSGRLNGLDLALLSVNQVRLPVGLRLRRNPLCYGSLRVGTPVVVVYPERTVRARVVPPLLIAPQFRQRYHSLISEAQGSGSGVFDARRKCLLGIISEKIEQITYQNKNGRLAAEKNKVVGYFVPAPTIAGFIAPGSRF
jgi:hypothetical protein